MLTGSGTPVIGFTACSGTGKTTLLVKLLPLLRERGLRVGLIKHAHHRFEVDVPGKDSFELRKAGASPVMIASKHRWAIMKDTPDSGDPSLKELLVRFEQEGLDLILVEGFKYENFPKVELHRPSLGKELFYPSDRSIIAIAADAPPPEPPPIPLLDINNPQAIADFLVQHAGL